MSSPARPSSSFRPVSPPVRASTPPPAEAQPADRPSSGSPPPAVPHWPAPHPQTEPVPGWRPIPPEARKRRGTIFWDVLLGLDLAFIGLGVLIALAAYLRFLTTGDPIIQDAGSDSLWAANFWNLLMMGIIPLLWVAGTRVSPGRGLIRYLHLDRPFPAVVHGFGYAALLVGLVLLLFLVLAIAGVPMEDTGGGERFVSITLPLVFVTSAVAGFAEEVLFRGVLQRWVGVYGQAVLFGLAHIPGGLLAFLVTGSIGLLFGLLVKNGRSLWLVITAHFAYDVMLLLMQYAAGRA